MPIGLVGKAGPTEAQIWQIGQGVRLLATPLAGEGAPPAGPEAGDCPTLLVCDYVPSQLGAQLRAQGTCYADAAGNAWLRHPALLVSVQGCARPQASELIVASPTRHVQLLRLLFHLVLQPELATHPVPTLAGQVQLPVAVVQQVLRDLAAQGFWDSGAPLGSSPLLLAAPAHYWLAHYASTLRRRLNAQRYRPRQPTALAEWQQRPLPAECLWGGEAAARLLLACAELPTSLTIHSHVPRAQLVQQLDLVPDTKGPLELLNAFAPATCTAPTHPRCVPPLLVYADLLAHPKPAHEALAPKLRAHYLADLLA
jgi:hypothetical protein